MPTAPAVKPAHPARSLACHHGMHDECRPCGYCAVKCACPCHAPKPAAAVAMARPSLTYTLTLTGFCGLLVGLLGALAIWYVLR